MRLGTTHQYHYFANGREIGAYQVAGYNPEDLDELCLSGEVSWARLSPHAAWSDPLRQVRPTRMAPISFFVREDASWLVDEGFGEAQPANLSAAARETYEALSGRGASFFSELVRETGRSAKELEDALWELTACGLVTADGFENLRVLIDPKRRRAEGGRQRHAAGRWALVSRAGGPPSKEARTESQARQLLLRWGVLFRDLLARESAAPAWRELLPVLRRMEAKGEIRGGRFVAGFTGEQYARAEAIDLLRAVRRGEPDVVEAAPSDPLNLVGIILPGSRVSRLSTGTAA